MFKSKILWLLPTFSMLFFGNVGTLTCMKIQEPIVIAESNEMIVLENGKPESQISLKLTKSFEKKENKNYSISFGNVQLDELPDGVYEVYLSENTSDLIKNSPDDATFINVLDLYTFQNNSTSKSLLLDFSQQIKNKITSPTLYLKVVFKGNQLANGSASKKVGKIKISNIKLIQND